MPSIKEISRRLKREMVNGSQSINKKYRYGVINWCNGGIWLSTYTCININKMNRIIFLTRRLIDF
jgi:hypothetical protein